MEHFSLYRPNGRSASLRSILLNSSRCPGFGRGDGTALEYNLGRPADMDKIATFSECSAGLHRPSWSGTDVETPSTSKTGVFTSPAFDREKGCPLGSLQSGGANRTTPDVAASRASVPQIGCDCFAGLPIPFSNTPASKSLDLVGVSSVKCRGPASRTHTPPGGIAQCSADKKQLFYDSCAPQSASQRTTADRAWQGSGWEKRGEDWLA